ncbi:uncharacterized protein LOC112510767 isoform X2 [Cynara cardunculus var. scolymus]|uniref:uncharacterized protein LOC112510767 isoform X2 n=1 Tax=Cynara cardunculus var. scolymus TaxID=59895 RepID=UPI000D628574|nr:uncharacterized protein LOC112510767 isoform X2 [Cynara cardunculus var. scolymus]
MEMDLEANRERIGFKNFPIRKFVSSIREKDPEKCWPFASLCAYKDFESISLVHLNISEDAEAPKLSEGETSKGKEAGSDTLRGFELEIPIANDTGSDTATGYELEISKGKETAIATARGLELEISKGNDIGFGTATGNTDKVNSIFTIDSEDDSNDDTLGLFLKKRKGVEVTRRAWNKKKQKRLQVEKTRPKAVKRPNLGPEGSRTMTKKANYEKLAEAPVAGALGSEHGGMLTGPEAGGSKGPGTCAAMPCDGHILMITVNRNPGDFSAPDAGNRFMRGGYSE